MKTVAFFSALILFGLGLVGYKTVQWLQATYGDAGPAFLFGAVITFALVLIVLIVALTFVYILVRQHVTLTVSTRDVEGNYWRAIGKRIDLEKKLLSMKPDRDDDIPTTSYSVLPDRGQGWPSEYTGTTSPKMIEIEGIQIEG